MTSLRTTIATLVLAVAASQGAARADEAQPSRPATPDPTQAPSCLKDTGSRIPGKGHPCAGVGRSYTDENIKSTGQTSVGDALHLLDPSITVHK